MFTVFILGLLAQTGDAQALTGQETHYFISGDYQDIVQTDAGLFAASGFGIAKLSPDLDKSIHTPCPDYTRMIAAYRDRVYLGGRLITEFQIRDGRAEYVGEKAVEGRLTALQAGPGMIAAGTDQGDVALYKITPQGLEDLKTLKVPGPVHDMTFAKGFLYLACDRNGIHIVDEQGEIQGNIPVSGVSRIAAGDGRLFAATNYGVIKVFSLKDPSQPVETDEYKGSTSPTDLVYFDKHLYVALGYPGYAVYDQRGRMLELSRRFKEGYVAGILPTPQGVYICLRERGVVKLQGRRPDRLDAVSRLEQTGSSLHTSRGGAYWAVAQGRNGVRLLRIAGEDVDRGYANPRPTDAAGVGISGTNLYVADASRGVSIFSLKDFPSCERDFDLFQPGTPMRFAFSQELILLASGKKGFRVLWICPCGPLKEKAVYEDGVYALDVAVADSIAYVADPDSGLRVIAMREAERDKLELMELDSYQGVISPQALLREDSLLYVADSVGAVIVLDISDAKNPTQLSFTPIQTRPRGMALSGSTLYVACGEDGVLAIDVGDPADPTIGEFIDTPGNALAVAASDIYLGVADYTSWVFIPID